MRTTLWVKPSTGMVCVALSRNEKHQSPTDINPCEEPGGHRDESCPCGWQLRHLFSEEGRYYRKDDRTYLAHSSSLAEYIRPTARIALMRAVVARAREIKGVEEVRFLHEVRAGAPPFDVSLTDTSVTIHINGGPQVPDELVLLGILSRLIGDAKRLDATGASDRGV